MGAVGAGDAAKPATQEALDWGTCLDVGLLARPYRKGSFRPEYVTSKDSTTQVVFIFFFEN